MPMPPLRLRHPTPQIPYIRCHQKKQQALTSLQPQVIIYTDGSSRGNPGPGGYGVVLIAGAHRKELSAGFRLTTNNRMELMAVIIGLESLKKPGLRVVVYSDSQYVVKAVEEGWLRNWLRNDFKGGKKNPDLWRRFDKIFQQHRVKFVWVKGHADNPNNNRCDELATAAADGHHLQADEWFEQNQA
jgi:ribonuclease HI